MPDHAQKEIRSTSPLQRQIIKHNSTSYVRNFNLNLNWVNFIEWFEERIALTRFYIKQTKLRRPMFLLTCANKAKGRGSLHLIEG